MISAPDRVNSTSAINPDRKGYVTMPWTTGDPCLHFEMFGSGQPIILLHEIGGSLFSWEPAAALLADDYTVIRYDQRGAGLSERPIVPFEIVDQVADLEQIIAAVGLPGPFVLATIAASATIASAYALNHPHRVRALILCAPALGLEAEQRGPARARAEATAQAGMRSMIDVAMERMYPSSLRRSDYDAYRARFLSHDPAAFARATLAFANADIVLEDLNVPTLLLAGAQDIRPPEIVEQSRAAIRFSLMRVIDGAGHVLPHQAPEQTALAIKAFVDGLSNITADDFQPPV